MPLLDVQHLQKTYTTRFGAHQVQALADVSFTVEPGEYVAIMGESGSGKTTLLNILAALDRSTAGEVLLGGRSLSAIREKQLAAFRRSHLGFVFQDFNLLDTFSLRDNILLPLVLAGERPAAMERKLMPLAQRLGISELLSKYPYEVSGGQKQRISIARVFLKNPAILILDEATSSIDTRTEKLIEKGMDALMDGRTVFVIAHRLSTVRNSKAIMVLEKGEIIERGSHDELIDQRGRYYKLYTGQFELE